MYKCKLSGLVVILSSILLAGNAVATENRPVVEEVKIAQADSISPAEATAQEGGEAADYAGGGKPQKPMTQLDPASIKLDPFAITPWVNLTSGSDDNVSLAPSVKTRSNYTMFNPSLAVELKGGTQSYTALYSGSFVRYASSSLDNYNDNSLAFDAENSWATRFNTLLHLDYSKGHDGRNSLVVGRNVELWHNSGLRAMARYGAKGAQGQIEVEAGLNKKRYETNQATMSFFDVDTQNLAASYFHRVGAGTQALVQVRDLRLSYLLSPLSSSVERRYLVGAQWEATAKTTGSFKIGKLTKSFNAGTVPSHSAVTWEGEVRWTPLTYSSLDFIVNKATNESSGIGNFMTTRQESLAWNHDWSSRVRTTLTLGSGKDSYQGVAQEDSRSNYGVKASYGIQRWLRVGAEIQQQKRDSTDPNYIYTRNLALFTLEGSI